MIAGDPMTNGNGNGTSAPRDRARWLVRLRWIGLGIGALVILLAWALASEALETSKALGLGVVLGVVAVANGVLDASLRSGAPPERAMFVAILSDAVLITIALHMTGGVENPFQVYYLFPVIVAGIALPRRRSYLVALVASLLFVGLAALEYTKVLPHHDVYLLPIWRSVGQQALDQYEDWRYVLGTSTVLVSTLLGASYLTTSIASQLTANESALAEAKDRLEGILRALGEGVAYFDANGALVLANESFTKLLPTNPRARLLDVAPAGLRPSLEEALSALRAGEAYQSFEAKDGQRVFACGLSAVRGAGGFAWVIEDVTERRSIEERATLDKRLVDLGVLAAGIAHEVLNPLASISTTAEVIESEPGEPVRERVAKIKRQVDRITRIVRGVAELARPTGARPVSVALDEILADAVSRAREERPNGGAVALEVAHPTPRAVAAEEPLRVAVKNLVTNALDAAGREGHVTVRARSEGDDAVIEVEDDGPGIADPERIFVPFFTTKAPGSGAGLGLPIAASIVRQHGGEIEVASAPGHGAKFRLRLPGRTR